MEERWNDQPFSGILSVRRRQGDEIQLKWVPVKDCGGHFRQRSHCLPSSQAARIEYLCTVILINDVKAQDPGGSKANRSCFIRAGRQDFDSTPLEGPSHARVWRDHRVLVGSPLWAQTDDPGFRASSPGTGRQHCLLGPCTILSRHSPPVFGLFCRILHYWLPEWTISQGYLDSIFNIPFISTFFPPEMFFPLQLPASSEQNRCSFVTGAFSTHFTFEKFFQAYFLHV